MVVEPRAARTDSGLGLAGLVRAEEELAERLLWLGRRPELDVRRVEAWLERVVSDYSDRILSFDLDCAQVWGKLMSPNPQHAIDKQIAAIALIYDLTVVTRNIDDFESSGVRSINPFN